MIDFVHELKKRQFAPVAPTVSPQWHTWLWMLALSIAVYLPAAWSADLLMFDDAFFFGPTNPEFQEGWRAVAQKPIANAYLPVAHLSLYFDYTIGGGSSLWAHVHALLVHALAGVVLARLMLQLGVGRVAAHVVAAMFIVHPALCESVAWVSSRKYVLSGLFTFAALFQTVRFAHAPTVWRAIVLAVLAAAAMFSNATSVVLPILSVGVVLWSRGPKARWWAPAVLFATTIPIALWHQSIAAEQGTMVAGDAMQRLAQAPGAFWHYLQTAVWPTQLNVLYPEIDSLAAFRDQWLPGTAAFAVFAVVGVVGWFWRSTRAMAAGLLAFCVALLPFNTAYPASSIAAADRYLYLAVPGLALAITAATALVHRRGPWLAAVLVAPLALLASVRATDFENDATLWRSSLAVEDVNAVAHFNLAFEIERLTGGALTQEDLDSYRGHLESAVAASRYGIHELRARRKLRPLLMRTAEYEAAADNAVKAIAAAKTQLAVEGAKPRIEEMTALLRQTQIEAFEPLQLSGDEAQAAEVLAEIKLAAPESPDVIAFQAMLDLSARRPELLALAKAGKAPRLAKDDAGAAAVDATLQAAIAKHPEHSGLWLSQALWHQARHQMSKAIRCFHKASDIKPDSVTAWLSSARMMREEGMYESAYKRALGGFQVNKDPRLLQEVALSLVGLGQLAQAQEYLATYMKLRPDDKDSGRILSNLLIGRALEMLSDNTKRDQVRKAVEDALRFNPNETKAHLVMGRLAHQERRFGVAVQHLEKAHELLPNYADAREQLARSLAAHGYMLLANRDYEKATDAWMRCIEIAPEGFDVEAVRGQLKSSWERFKERGIDYVADGKVEEAIADYRRCLLIDPDNHMASWLLAISLHTAGDENLTEMEDLCRKAVAWQKGNKEDTSRQVYLLAITLQRRGKEDEAQQIAAEYMQAPHEGAEPAVLRALKQLADS